jgi:hypothetical protein
LKLLALAALFFLASAIPMRRAIAAVLFDLPADGGAKN